MTTLGVLHLASAITSLTAGTITLLLTKGTTTHKRVGYFYFYSMIYMNASSLLMYNLTGQFNGFHVGAILSLLTIVVGIGAMYVPGKRNLRTNLHLSMMFWSVVGLYAALFSEILTRVSGLPFVWAVIIPTCVIMILGFGIFIFQGKKWIMAEPK